LHKEYSCFMTFYGSYRFYELPRSVFLNVAMGKDAEFLFETMGLLKCLVSVRLVQVIG